MLMIYIVTPKLGKILKERNMTQTQLSELSGVPQGTISKFDKNKQHTDWHLVAIAKALNISIDDLFEVDIQYEIDDLFNEKNESNNNSYY
jgi:transcriptional regulator with XRE-family HTH domain